MGPPDEVAGEALVSRFRTHILPAIILVAALSSASALLWPEPQAVWIAVEAPRTLTAGQPFVADVTLSASDAAAYLNFDLHGQDVRGEYLGCIAASDSRALTGAGLRHTFVLTLPESTPARSVDAVIYLSTSGRWPDASRVARSETLAVLDHEAGVQQPATRRLRTHDDLDDPGRMVRDVPEFRILLAALWLGATFVAARSWRAQPELRRLPATALACAVLCAWELTGAGTHMSETARALARELHLYGDRRVVQLAASLACLGGGAALAAVAVRRPARHFPAAATVGFSLYAVVTVAGMLSLHEVDRVLAHEMFSLPVAALLRCAAVLSVLAGVILRPSPARS